MRQPIFRVLTGIVWSALAVATAAAQTATTTSETKKFTVVAVEGNQLVVKLPEGTREITVPDGFTFTVNGQPMSVSELKPGMSGTATITTTTIVKPVTVTEVKNGTVEHRSGGSILVRTDQGYKNFTEGDLEKRGVKIFKDGKPVGISGLNAGDRLSATIVTEKPPQVLTQRQVDATLAKVATATSGAAATGAPAATAPASGGTSTPAATKRTLPKTASPVPLWGFVGAASGAIGLMLTVRRRRRATE
ncbi:MAG TPA: hypothetical protein VFT47_06395 [Vicinamibacterales bacterium]|nr:hypothetical protein [Vicinamibacterales bacterium]